MISLAATLTMLVGDAFAAEGLARELGQVQLSDRPDLASFQCNGALAAAKIAKANPRAIAEKIAARLKVNPIFARVEIAGPGFLNLDVTDEVLGAGVGAAGQVDIDRLIELDILLYGLSLVLEFAALIALRIRQPNLPRPFRIPGRLAGVVAISIPPVAIAGWAVFAAREEQVSLGAFKIPVLAFGAVVGVAGMLAYLPMRLRRPSDIPGAPGASS